MQQRFHELARERDKLLEAIKPLQDKYDALRAEENAISARIKPIAAELRAAKAPLYDIDNERAALSRALNGQTGKPA